MSFDPALVEEAFEDDVEGLAEFLRSVISRLLENCQKVHALAASGDAPGVRAAAHAAKGSAGHLGGRETEQLAGRIELSAKDGTIEDASILAQLDEAVRDLQGLVEAYITRRAAQRGPS